MPPDLPLLLFVKSRITFNLKIIIFADFIKPKALTLIFKADHRQTFFHVLMIQKNQLSAFSESLNIFNLTQYPDNTSIIF